jgi:hypothetical protein
VEPHPRSVEPVLRNEISVSDLCALSRWERVERVARSAEGEGAGPQRTISLTRAFGADAIVVNTGVPAWDPVRRQLNEFCGTTFPFSPSLFE